MKTPAIALPTAVTLPRSTRLVPGVLLKRYKRFFADVRMENGETVVAHCANTGAMEGLTAPGARVWLEPASNPERKLKFTWELVEAFGTRVVGVNTSRPNQVVGELLKQDALPWLRPSVTAGLRPDATSPWEETRSEKPYGDCRRIDFWMRSGAKELYLEVKNCHLAYEDGRAYFPDSVSERAAHHVKELGALVSKNVRAHVLFFVQMPHVTAVRPSDVHDPAFAVAAREAHAAGVEFSAIVLSQTAETIVVERAVPVEMAPYATAKIAEWRRAAKAAVA